MSIPPLSALPHVYLVELLYELRASANFAPQYHCSYE